ncbi:glycosyltransferase domain protein [Mycobacterium xenopi 4042]|uniref:Glycosyltransferase domain protein n=1 Tax=Mycobacterium xenopi 4042 TaxID=1299334 RepID=X8EYV1_MYCXE|nr:glycosyltransferase domain protein [Mycobacterium xenopi 4042]
MHLIGACAFEPAPSTAPAWLSRIEQPSCWCPRRRSAKRIRCWERPRWRRWPVNRSMWSPPSRPAYPRACRGHPMRLCANTSPTARCWPSRLRDHPRRHGNHAKGARLRCSVCVVPFARDQAEVARRVEMARCGTRLPAKKLTARRLRAACTRQ